MSRSISTAVAVLLLSLFKLKAIFRLPAFTFKLKSMARGRSSVVLLLSLLCAKVSTAPVDTSSLVVSTTESNDKEATKENKFTEITQHVPKIYQMHVQSDISNRFSHTTITSKVKNIANKAEEATFSVVLPESAFISEFIMEVDGKNYTAYVKEKEEAKRDYEQAAASGLGAAHVAVSARDSNRFTISVNIEPEKKAAFYLTYEQLLKRKNGRYEQIINLHPGQPVQDLSVEVVISESRKITDLKVPPIRSGNEIGNENTELDSTAAVQTINDTTAIIKFVPNIERQKQLANILGTNENEGLSGQFVIQYDVERDPKGGEVLVQDGYFVHFFAPTDLKPLSKYVVFVLDTSSSMIGEKIEQLKQAMYKILEQLHENDLFSLVEFNDNAKVWDLDNTDFGVWFPRNYLSGMCAIYAKPEETEVSFSHYKFPKAYIANANNIKKAKEAVAMLEAVDATDIYSALRVGLHLVESEKFNENKYEPMIMFLTDGQPTIREKSTEAIINKITEFNSGKRKSAIFTLSFGSGAVKNFLEKLAARNSGFHKHIYEAADASLQLQDFYNQISSPLLTDVTFKYEPSVTSLTQIKYPIMFGGSELVIAGRSGTDDIKESSVNAHNLLGEVHFAPTVKRTVSNIERLWAYLTVRQLLDKKEVENENQDAVKKKALDLALKYSFVTLVSSLVVVKPNATFAVDTENAASEVPQNANVGGLAQSFGGAAGVPMLGSPPNIIQSLQGGGVSGFGLSQSVDILGSNRFGPSITYTTPFCPPLTFPVTENPNLLTTLSWLNDILKDNGILKLPTGEYKLGLNETISETVACPKTLLNAPGHCKLLKECPQVHSDLTSAEVFIKHFCILKDEFAGICCP